MPHALEVKQTVNIQVGNTCYGRDAEYASFAFRFSNIQNDFPLIFRERERQYIGHIIFLSVCIIKALGSRVSNECDGKRVVFREKCTRNAL